MSREEQKKRFLKRLDTPEKNWKFSASDVHERKFWRDYMRAYEGVIRATASKHAPWFVVPADNRWFTRLVVAATIVEAVEQLNLCMANYYFAYGSSGFPVLLLFFDVRDRKAAVRCRERLGGLLKYYEREAA